MNPPPTRTRAFVALLLAALAAATPAAARADDVAAKLAEYMDAAAKFKKFSGSVIVAKDGTPLLRKGYGLANAEHDVPNGPETKFRLGSVTKQFTAMAILILEDRGKLKVTDKISEHLDDTPDAWKGVTIHHLLTHTSGIPSYTAQPDYRDKMREAVTLKSMIARFRDKPLDFEPGTKWDYSNSGYFLLGAIIEKASGKSYEAFLREAIFEPLGMRDTGYDHYETVLKHRAAGYRREGDALVHDEFLDMSQPYAAGSLYSTVDDLLTWDRALAAGKLIPADAYRRMFTPEKDNYAYGIVVRTELGRPYQDHGGGINGFLTQFARFPDDGVVIAVLCNVTSSDPQGVASDLAKIVFGEPYELPRERKVATVAPEVLKAYAGRYKLAMGMVLDVALEGDRLMGAPVGQPKLPLVPESETEFYVEQVDAQIRFTRDDSGKANELVLRQRGRDVKGERVEDDPKAEAKPADKP